MTIKVQLDTVEKPSKRGQCERLKGAKQSQDEVEIHRFARDQFAHMIYSRRGALVNQALIEIVSSAFGLLAMTIGGFFQRTQLTRANKTPFSLFFVGVFIGLVLISSPAGCETAGNDLSYSAQGEAFEGSKSPWPGGFTYSSRNYTVFTDTSPETAERIALLMEKALDGYIQVTGYQGEGLPRFIVYAYATREEYEAAVRRNNFPADITDGFYTPESPAAIHVPYVRGGKRHPSEALVHEGTHQFIDQAMRFEVPSAAKDFLSPSEGELASVPLWLNEGLATYMESSVVDGNRIEIGRLNRQRLKHLKNMLRRGKAPALREVLAKPYGEPFSAADYAVSWGVVYSLGKEDVQPDGRKRLLRYLDACRQGFYEDPSEEFPRQFLLGGKKVEGFQEKWFAYVAERSLVFFEKIAAGDVGTIEEWERDWIKRIRQINI